MRREHIRSTPSWRKHGARRDCAFAVEDQDKPGFWGMSVVHVKLFFSFTHDGVDYPCALVEWFKKWSQSIAVKTVSLVRGAHLIPVFGSTHIPVGFSYRYSLDAFKAFHVHYSTVNKYIDHHANEIAF
ncbi:hypothetical protein B0H14DRAFT_3095168 [Mycena olivaceomarginata]|nr:hypothetical protein B0H14DRAFT_3095168 [Mycena olivaceomarginata]